MTAGISAVTANPGCPMQGAPSIERAGRPLALAHTVEVLDPSIRWTSSASIGVAAGRTPLTER